MGSEDGQSPKVPLLEDAPSGAGPLTVVPEAGPVETYADRPLVLGGREGGGLAQPTDSPANPRPSDFMAQFQATTAGYLLGKQEAVQKAVDTQGAQVASLQQGLAHTQQAAQGAFSQIGGEVHAHREEIEVTKARTGTLEAVVGQTQAALGGQGAALGTVDARLRALEQIVEPHLRALEPRVMALEQEHGPDQLQGEAHQAIAGHMAHLYGRMEQVEGRADILEHQVASLEAQVQDLGQELASQRAENILLQDRIGVLEAENKQLEYRMDVLEAEKKEEMGEIRKQIAALQTARTSGASSSGGAGPPGDSQGAGETQI